MNKIKYVLPILVAPVLFGCNKGGVVGVYTLDSADKISVEFTKGDGEEYKTSGFTSLSDIQTDVYNKFNYGDGTIHLESEPAIPSKTVSGEEVTSYPVNLKDGTISFEYGKIKSGYHFFGNYSAGLDSLQVYWNHQRSSSVDINELVVENGFTVNGNKLTINLLGSFELNNELKFRINFTLIAIKK